MDLDPSTRALHGPEPLAPGAPLVPPLVLTSTFASAGDPADVPLAYARYGNPTWSALEDALGRLEDARATTFASGLGATHALLLALMRGRQRLLLLRDGYHGVRELAKLLAERGVRTDLFDPADREALGRALAEEPAVVWIESPTNPFLRVFDVAGLAEVARSHGAPLVVDNTTATPALQRPLDFGATATVTSITKATSGHSDVLLGSVATRDDDLHERVRTWRGLGGAIPGPFEAFLAHRGVQSLPLRVERQSRTAGALAGRLAGHPRVLAVHYPGLDPETADLAGRQMPRGFGPLLSFELEGGAPAADAAIERAKLIRPATSFGGVESTWERRGRWPGEVAPDGLIRLSVGLEAEVDLWRDVERALDAR